MLLFCRRTTASRVLGRFGRLCLLLACSSLLLVSASGCKEGDTIRSYQVDKQHIVEKSNPSKPRPQKTAAAPVAGRMLLAMVPQGEQAWFFKLQGPLRQVGAEEDKFNQFVQSIRFEENKPLWTLPEGWTQRDSAGEMRFATLLAGSSTPPLELAISSLPYAAESEEAKQQYLLDNVNRWRRQMQLPAVDQAGLAGSVHELTVADQPSHLVDLVGMLPAGPMSAMGSTPPSAPAPSSSQPEAPAASSELTYETPEGWTPGSLSGGFRKAAFNIEQDGRKAELTVIDLGGQSGSTEDNVNRWRGQIGLEPLDAEQLKTELAPITTADGTSGHVVFMAMAEDASPRQAILGAILPAGEKTWYVKLQGDAQLAEQQRPQFEKFVQSLKFTKD